MKHGLFKKTQKRRLKGVHKANQPVARGAYSLLARSNGFLDEKHFRGLKLFLAKKFKQKGSAQLSCAPLRAVTKKSLGARQGKGKGVVSHATLPIRAGLPIIFFTSSNINILLPTLRSLQKKLPLRSILVSRFAASVSRFPKRTIQRLPKLTLFQKNVASSRVF